MRHSAIRPTMCAKGLPNTMRWAQRCSARPGGAMRGGQATPGECRRGRNNERHPRARANARPRTDVGGIPPMMVASAACWQSAVTNIRQRYHFGRRTAAESDEASNPTCNAPYDRRAIQVRPNAHGSIFGDECHRTQIPTIYAPWERHGRLRCWASLRAPRLATRSGRAGSPDQLPHRRMTPTVARTRIGSENRQAAVATLILGHRLRPQLRQELGGGDGLAGG